MAKKLGHKKTYSEPSKLIPMPMLTKLPTNYRCYWVIICIV